MPRTTKSTRSAPSLPTSTFILDSGAHTIKAGFAPPALLPSDTDTLQNCHVVPNTLIRTRDKKIHVAAQSQEITQWSEALYRRPMENGQVVSWEVQQEIWDQSFFDERIAGKEVWVKEPESTTLVLTEMPNGLPSLGKMTDEMVMEDWGLGGYMRVVGVYGRPMILWEGVSADMVTGRPVP
jgi:actin-related protein 6